MCGHVHTGTGTGTANMKRTHVDVSCPGKPEILFELSRGVVERVNALDNYRATAQQKTRKRVNIMSPYNTFCNLQQIFERVSALDDYRATVLHSKSTKMQKIMSRVYDDYRATAHALDDYRATAQQKHENAKVLTAPKMNVYVNKQSLNGWILSTIIGGLRSKSTRRLQSDCTAKSTKMRNDHVSMQYTLPNTGWLGGNSPQNPLPVPPPPPPSAKRWDGLSEGCFV